jgi:hypothetical protein
VLVVRLNLGQVKSKAISDLFFQLLGFLLLLGHSVKVRSAAYTNTEPRVLLDFFRLGLTFFVASESKHQL